MEHTQSSYSNQSQALGQNTNGRNFQPSLYLDDYRSESWNGYAAMSGSPTESRVLYNRWQNFPMQMPHFNSSQNVRLPMTSSQNDRQTLRMAAPPSLNSRRPDFGSPQNVRPSYMRMPPPLTNTRESDRPPFSNIQHNNTGPHTGQPNFWRHNMTGSSTNESSFGYGHASSYQSMNFNPMSLYRGFPTNNGPPPYHFNNNFSPQFGNKQQYQPVSSHIGNRDPASVNTTSGSGDQSSDAIDDRSILGKWYKLPDSDKPGITDIEECCGSLEDVMTNIENLVNKERPVSNMPGLLTNSPVHDVSVSLELQEVTREGDQNREDSNRLPIMETENRNSGPVTEENFGTYVVEKVKNKRKRKGSQKQVTPITIRMLSSGRSKPNQSTKSLSYGLPVSSPTNDIVNHRKNNDQPHRKTQIVKPMIDKARKNTPGVRILESFLFKKQKQQQDVTSNCTDNSQQLIIDKSLSVENCQTENVTGDRMSKDGESERTLSADKSGGKVFGDDTNHYLDPVGSDRDTLDKGKEGTGDLESITVDSHSETIDSNATVVIDKGQTESMKSSVETVRDQGDKTKSMTSSVETVRDKGDKTESVNRKDKNMKSPENDQSGDPSVNKTNSVEGNEEKQNPSGKTKKSKALVVKLFDVRKCKNMKKMFKNFKIEKSSSEPDRVSDTVNISRSKCGFIELDSEEEDFSFPAFSCFPTREIQTNSVSVSELETRAPANITNRMDNQEQINGDSSLCELETRAPANITNRMDNQEQINGDSSLCELETRAPANITNRMINQEQINGDSSIDSPICDETIIDSNAIIDSESNSQEEDKRSRGKSTSKHDDSKLPDVLPSKQYRKGLARKRHRSNVNEERKKRQKRHSGSQNSSDIDQQTGGKNQYISDLSDHSTESETKEPIGDSGKNHGNDSHISDASDHPTVSKTQEPIGDSGKDHGNSEGSPGKNLGESTDLVDILSRIEQYFNIEFHGSSILCVSINTGKYLVMKELLTKCFKSIMKQNKGTLSSKFKQVYLAKERDLKIPYKELPDCNRHVVAKHLVSQGILVKENQHHIGIISLSDALRLYHYFYGVKSCINCLKFIKSQSQDVALPKYVTRSDSCEDDGEESDSTIQYEFTDDDDDTDDETVETDPSTHQMENRVLKGGIAELYSKMFRFIVIESCKYFPFKDLELFCKGKKIEQIIKTGELKTRDCTEMEGSFFCKLEPSLPTIIVGDRLVEEKVLHEAAKCFVNQSKVLNKSSSEECLSQPDVEMDEVGEVTDKVDLNPTAGDFIDLTICDTEHSSVTETDMNLLQILGQRSCDRFDSVFEDIGHSRNICNDICPKVDENRKTNSSDAEDIVSMLNDALSRDGGFKSLEHLDKKSQLEEVEAEDLKNMFCVCQKSFNENQKMITRAFLAVWKQNISLKQQVNELKSEIEDVNSCYDTLETKRKKYEDMIEQLTNG